MEVIVEDKQLSLAIGKKGQNVRLAAKLTGWKIDIKSEEEKRREVEVAARRARDRRSGPPTPRRKPGANRPKRNSPASSRRLTPAPWPQRRGVGRRRRAADGLAADGEAVGEAAEPGTAEADAEPASGRPRTRKASDACLKF